MAQTNDYSASAMPAALVVLRAVVPGSRRRGFHRCERTGARRSIEGGEEVVFMTHTAALALRVVAIVLMLAGVVMIFTASSSALAIALITVGIAIVAIIEADRRRHGHAHP